ncbi:hypothetical protein K439DRAFT_1624301 [Ramaria rubella]|nr:hypothetical protein K439DRAFT_1624301 [Ramaria rubella]
MPGAHKKQSTDSTKAEKPAKSTSKKIKLIKQPVKLATLGLSLLAKKYEKTKRELAELCKNLRDYEKPAEESSSAKGSKAKGPEPPQIPKPKGEVGCTGTNTKKAGYNLQKAMGLGSKKALYNRIRVSPT